MDVKNCVLSKNQHKEASIAAFGNLFHDTDFTDVTLACSENKQVFAHKVILSTCSPFFKKILLKNPHKDMLIYLKGVSHSDLTSVIEFMYLGQTKVSKEGLETFLLAAQELQVEGLAFEGVEKEETGREHISSQGEELGRLQEGSNEEKEEYEWGGRERAEVFGEMMDQDVKPPAIIFNSDKEKDHVEIQKDKNNFCEISDKCVTKSREVISQSELVKSVNVKAETSEPYIHNLIPEISMEESNAVKTNFPAVSSCLECGKLVKSRHINRHIKEKHQGKKEEPCSLCGHSFTRKESKDLHVCRSDPILYPFKCFDCNLRLMSQKKLEMHNKNRSKVCYRFKCLVCNSFFSSMRSFECHKLDNPNCN